MPSGRTHDRITLWSLPWIVCGSFFLTRNGELTLLIAATFLFSGLMFGPDLDIHSVQFKRWGALRWLWKPYQKCVGHRSRLSHGFIVGTVFRLIYLGTFLGFTVLVGVGLAQLVWGFSWNWQQMRETSLAGLSDYRWHAIASFVGLELGAMSHAIADTFSTTLKRVRRQGLKGVLSPKKSRKRRKSPPRKR